jgi:hypothetical protein
MACPVDESENEWACWGLIDGHGQKVDLSVSFLKKKVPSTLHQGLLNK